MQLYHYLVLLLILSAAFAYINQRFIRLPFVIGLFLLATGLSVGIVALRPLIPFEHRSVEDLMQHLDVSHLITDVMLAFLLFAGGLHTDWSRLRPNLRPVLSLAILGTLLSTFIIGGLLYYVSAWINLPLPLPYCFIFGALISPTDPIAVLGILKKAKVPVHLENTIVGESLFNDGIGIVLFIAFTSMMGGSGEGHSGGIAALFAQEVGGGIALGFALGYVLHRLLRSVDHYQTEILLTLAFVSGGYWLCSELHFSGPLAMVIMGLLMGNFRPEKAMTDITQQYVHKFWELIDVILNAILFILIALVMVVVELRPSYLLLGLLSIGLILGSRILIVGFMRRFARRFLALSRAEGKVIVWGGLRGGLSVALVLSLPESEYKEALSVVTYVVVVFSILVQGLTVGRFANRVLQKSD